MKRTTLATIGTVLTVLTVVLVPAVTLADFQLPTNPVDNGSTYIDGNRVMNIIESALNWAVTLGMIIAVAYFVWGAFNWVRGGAKAGKDIMLNAAIGIAFMLAVGLIVNSIAAWVNRGLTLN